MINLKKVCNSTEIVIRNEYSVAPNLISHYATKVSSNSYLNCSTIALIKLNCYTISMDSNIITCRSQVRNLVGLRRFPSPHPSLFFWIFGGIFGLK